MVGMVVGKGRRIDRSSRRLHRVVEQLLPVPSYLQLVQVFELLGKSIPGERCRQAILIIANSPSTTGAPSETSI